MINKKKKSLFVIGAMLFASILSVGALSALIYKIAEADYEINKLPSFSATVDGNTFYCYRIKGETTNIAIGWGENPDDAPNETLSLPPILHNDDDADTANYVPVAIVNSGFSRCDFKKISLPDTIKEIGNGAFAYCEKMESFKVPPLVTKIKDSTFVDCRGLKSISYTENIAREGEPVDYVESTNNYVIQEIGDHAFDSCVSLIQFECPKSLTYIGVSAFQNCNKIARFYFPEKDAKYGNITVDSYAFADCTNLIWVYFEENLTTIKNYAFADCHPDLLFHYGHDFGEETPVNPTFSPNTEWNRKSIDGDTPDRYGFEETNHLIYSADGYLGLKIGITSSAVYLNSWKETTESPTNTIKLINAGSQYAVIYQWDNPGQDVQKQGDDFYYYRYNGGGNGSGVLTIPSSITRDGNEIPIKVIKTDAFKNKTELKEVHFKNNIVQIEAQAFSGCSNISTIDFEGVTTLKEIGGNVFNTNMDKVSSLRIPTSVEYIGPKAFYNFRKVGSLKFTTAADDAAGRHPNVKVIGSEAFRNIGSNLNSTLKINIPCSLNDADAIKASMNSSSGKNWAAIGSYSFASGKVTSITMDECSTGVHDSNKTSLAENAFNGCSMMTKFISNDNLCLIGSNAFASCGALKEVFLTTTTAKAYATSNPTKTYVWGTTNAGTTAGDSVFSGGKYPNLVIYLDGTAPGSIESRNSTSLNGNTVWNSEGTKQNSFSNFLGYSTNDGDRHLQGRKSIPTYYGIDFLNENDDTIIYLDFDNSDKLKVADAAPDTSADYFKGTVVLAKEGSNYTVAKYYVNNDANNNVDEINLASITGFSGTITKIGSCAFASNATSNSAGADTQSPCPGKYFILPTSVTSIGERAFFRKAVPDTVEDASDRKANIIANGVRIVTKVNGSTGSNYSTYNYATVKANYADQSDTNDYGYYYLPNVTRIENDAFFNNTFGAVGLSASTSYLGRSAFYTRFSSQMTSIAFDSANAYFEINNNGIYYTGLAGSKKALLYQAQDSSSTALDVPENTIAIGPAAVTNTNIVSADISGVEQIYGSAFQGNASLATVTGDSSLEYISAMPEQVMAYKIEKQKYVGLPNTDSARSNQDDLTGFGIVNVGATSNVSVTIVVYDDDKVGGDLNTKKLYRYVSSNGTVMYSKDRTINANSFLFTIEILENDTDILSTSDATLTSHIDLIDYRNTTNPMFAEYQNRNSAFKDCTSLTTINFNDMPNLIKIGAGAFKGCTNLSVTNTTPGATYKYYKYNGNKKFTLVEEKNNANGVLDLTGCERLRVIGPNAFEGCDNLKYVHLPYTYGRLFMARDYQTPYSIGDSYDNIDQKVFSNYGDSDKIRILVGDHEVKANSANRNMNDYRSVYRHYKSTWYGTNYIYYYAEVKTDLKGANAWYWTKDSHIPNGYILFESKSSAEHYFNNYSSLDWSLQS